MTQFRVGQRVRVVYGPFKGNLAHVRGEGFMDSTVLVELDGGCHLDIQTHKLTPIPAPGIPAHLVRTATDLPSRHWPVWRAQP